MSICGIPACELETRARIRLALQQAEERHDAIVLALRQAVERHDAIVLRDSTERLKQQIADILDEVEFNG